VRLSEEARDAQFDREFDGIPNPWIPDETDIEEEAEEVE